MQDGLGRRFRRLTKFRSSKEICQHLQDYVDSMTEMKVSYRVYVILIRVMLKLWATVALDGLPEVKERS